MSENEMNSDQIGSSKEMNRRLLSLTVAVQGPLEDIRDH